MTAEKASWRDNPWAFVATVKRTSPIAEAAHARR